MIELLMGSAVVAKRQDILVVTWKSFSLTCVTYSHVNKMINNLTMLHSFSTYWGLCFFYKRWTKVLFPQAFGFYLLPSTSGPAKVLKKSAIDAFFLFFSNWHIEVNRHWNPFTLGFPIDLAQGPLLSAVWQLSNAWLKLNHSVTSLFFCCNS